MWDEALAVLAEAERQQRRFCGLVAQTAPQPVWEPPADVFESDLEVLVCVALPGVAPESVTVHIVPSGLVVTADRLLPAAFERMHLRRLELPYGRFERRIELAPGQYALLDRRLVNGCLELRLAKG